MEGYNDAFKNGAAVEFDAISEHLLNWVKKLFI